MVIPIIVLSLVENFIVMLRQLSYAIKNQLKATKAPYKGHFLPFVGSLWHKDRWLPCTERIYYREQSLDISPPPGTEAPEDEVVSGPQPCCPWRVL